MTGSVIALLPNDRYQLELENGRVVEGTIPASSRALFTRVKVGDSLDVEISPYDRTMVRILAPVRRAEPGETRGQ